MIMKKNLYTTVLLLFLPFIVLIAENGEKIYNDKVLHEVRITTLSADAWQKVIQNYENGSKEYIPVNIEVDGQKVDNVGLRIKGNRLNLFSDRPKYESLKIDINEYEKKQTFQGLKKLNIKNRNLVANHLLYKLALENDIPSCRTSFTKVYIDNKYIGSYILIEQIDKTYLKNTFGSKKGNLYKASGKGGTLTYLGNDIKQYEYPYEKKTNKDEKDYTDLIDFLRFLKESNTAEFEKNIEKYLNIDRFVKALAIEMLCAKSDALYDAGRNYYLYRNPATSQFEYIVDDFDYTLSDEKYISLDFDKVIDEMQPYVGSPLITQIMKSDKIKKKYYQAVCSILNNGFKNMSKEIDRVEALTKNQDFNLYDLFDRPNTSETIKKYIHKKVEDVNSQLVKKGFDCNQTSVFEPKDKGKDIYVSPNPFSKQIVVNNIDNNQFEYAIYNSNGTLVSKGKNINSSNVINLEHLSNDFYLLIITFSESNKVFKLIKKN